MSSQKLETATLAGGCFWCTEAVFQRLKGVIKVTSGYSDDAEAIQIEFDPSVISYETLLEVFFKMHDPTSLNQQGADIGPQYRSAIFFESDTQRKIAEKLKSQIPGAVTEIAEFNNFIKAEDYHQNFYNSNKGYGYCQLVIDPKIKKLYKEFPTLTEHSKTEAN